MKRAVTLIELLVVIAIIAILAALLFPVFAQAKSAAKRSADLSNTKQITLAVIQYQGDSDDVPPLMQQTPAGAKEFTPRMLSWKDSIAPYVKSGGMPYNNGQKYSQTSGGGIFASPLAEMPWSSQGPSQGAEGWPSGIYPEMGGGTGDSTTRFARSYALNQQAGMNETDKGIIGSTQEEANGTVTFTWTSQPASATVLENPAGTLLVVPTRTYVPWATAMNVWSPCTAAGLPKASDLSCVRGTGNRNLTAGFFDGHAKNVYGPSTNAKDMWGIYGYYKRRYNAQPDGWAQEEADMAVKYVKEWRQ